MFYAANRQLGIFQKSEPDPLLGGVPAGRGGYVLPNILQTHPALPEGDCCQRSGRQLLYSSICYPSLIE
ncbi:MAG: hypothetical protein HC790_08635 [Acaryochloridaceae cyanobacterium CSU_3_4]|nr:hypothetical protein [Acaryochloridaceae cyanobacterium CSU_3_4]